MKQPVPFALRAILSFVLTAFSLQAWGLDCAPASINLVNQAEVDALSVTGCTTVIGGLGIATGSITSLEGLSNLTSVGEDLWISNNAALTNLDGLANLTSVGENLYIGSNTSLTTLDGLSGLNGVNGWLNIYNNSKWLYRCI
jgi:hypothetical protein